MLRLLLALPFGIAALTWYVMARTYRPDLVDRVAARSRTAYGLFLISTGGFLLLILVITITYLSSGREAAAAVIDILSIIALIPLFLVFLIALVYAFTVTRVRRGAAGAT